MQIPIVFITDNNYALPTGVAITSLIINKKPETVYKIHVIVTEDVSDENRVKLVASGKENAIVELIEIDASVFEEFRIPGRYVPPCALLKFKIPELLQQYDKIIYLDGDILILNDLNEFNNIDISDYFLGAISDIAAHRWHSSHKLLYLNNYYNSGVLLLNIKKMREENIEKTAFDIKKKNIDFHFIDQDVFNLSTQDNVKFCHVKYNIMMYNFNILYKDDLREFNNHYDTLYNTFDELLKEAVILHLTHICKPWKYKNAPFYDMWIIYFKESQFNNDKLELKEFEI